MADSINMSLDEIIKQNKQQNRNSRTRGRGRGGGTGRGGRGGRGRGGGRANSQTRAQTPGGQRQGRSRSRSRGGQLGRSQSRGRSRSRQNFRSQSQNRFRSRTRSRTRALTPKGRAGLEPNVQDMPPLVRRNRFNRGGLRRSNSVSSLHSNVHSRLGITTARGGNNRRPFARRGVIKRGRGVTTGNVYSNVGLRSDQIIQQQRQSLRLLNQVRSQTFTRSRSRSRSRNNSFSNPSQLTVKVANDFAGRRRNSFSNASNYLSRQTLQQLTNLLGGNNRRRGPGSVRSMGSNQSNRSNRSNRSMRSNQSNRSRGRGRGRGRGGNRGVGRNFVNKQILNPKLQKEIAAIQGKPQGIDLSEAAAGVNFAPTPAATTLTLHQRFGSI